MARETRFRTLLPVLQCALAALFGGIGLWQRAVILSHPFIGGEPLWNSTARFHVWPWPYKFAVVLNVPAFFGGALLVWPLGEAWPFLPEAVQAAPLLLFVAMLWYWVGSRLDRRWRISDKAPWTALFVFTLICLAGLFLPMGYVGYIPYGVVIWLIMGLAISRCTRQSPRLLQA